ncbi:hypothetical protein CKO38_03665 [Rhodospirillum rubrum]|uniref:hypothetical protein n=1 Tax=Rhodospirillum rubrum TaxID=1085 RepID=UPI00190658BC|nr:hypothetical protein [Rhodospirillum rubrum]MBK1663061.1 hypothetical protein [Rhodospirillum rubrum]MBK1675784.1 hypothetical protein [Rhodospirillum rubrum]
MKDVQSAVLVGAILAGLGIVVFPSIIAASGSNAIDSDTWTAPAVITIILTALAVMITVMAIILGALAVFGYQSIKEEAGRKAEQRADAVAREVADAVARKVAASVAAREARAAVGGSRETKETDKNIKNDDLVKAFTEDGDDGSGAA